MFDGVCNTCHAIVRWVMRWEKGPELRFVSIQSALGQALLAEFGQRGAVTLDTVWLLERGQLYTRSEAALRVCRYLKRPWNWGLALRGIPLGLRDGAYRLFARNRYRILGKKSACVLPDGATQARFPEVG